MVLSQQLQKGIKFYFLIRNLRSDSEDFMDECYLSCHILFIDSFDLSFADHGHRFIPFERVSSAVEGAKSQSRFDKTLDVSVILFDPVIEGTLQGEVRSFPTGAPQP